jgi:dTMP kinase
MKGLLVAFEGIDGSGKSTAIGYVHDLLRESQVDCTRTREPGGTPLAEKIRDLVLWGNIGDEEDFPDWAEVCLYNASRATHTQNMIIPHIEKGFVVLTDRYCDSTYAHQGGGRGLDIAKLQAMHNIVNDGLVPDITFLFDGSPDVFRARMAERQPDRLEKMPIDFQRRSRQVHLDLAAADPGRYIIINAEQTAENVRAQLLPGVMQIINQVRKRPVAV